MTRQQTPQQLSRGLSPQQPGSKRHHVLYLLAVIAVLLPGLFVRSGLTVDLGPRGNVALAALRAELDRIEFGSGWRFWFGVAGTSMMVLLLLYPLVKRFSVGRGVNIGRWFHAHIVLGLLGPILILYHARFGTGSFRANIAMFTMLTIVGSGLIGHYLYTWLAREFYGEKRTARELLDTAVVALRTVAGAPAAADVIAELEAFESETLTPRHGLLARIAGAYHLQAHRRRIMLHVHWLIARQAPRADWSAGAQDQQWALVSQPVADYFASTRRATRGSITERFAGAWRILHVPLFAVTVMATAAHVYAVWDLDPSAPPPVTTPLAPVAPKPALPQPTVAKRVTAKPQVAAAPPTPQATTANRPALAQTLPGTSQSVPTLLQGPQLARPPVPIKTAEPPEDPAVAELARRVQVPPAVVGKEVPPAVVKNEVPPAVAQSRVLSMTDRLNGLKAQNFDHTTTRFALTGRHVDVACTACHTTMIEQTPRTCVSCHLKDDNHRGQRPQCESCHVTSTWSRIVRRRGG